MKKAKASEIVQVRIYGRRAKSEALHVLEHEIRTLMENRNPEGIEECMVLVCFNDVKASDKP